MRIIYYDCACTRVRGVQIGMSIYKFVIVSVSVTISTRTQSHREEQKYRRTENNTN